MVGVYLRITLRSHLQVKQAVPCKQVQHMVKKRYSGTDRCRAGTVKLQLDRHFGLRSYPFNLSVAHDQPFSPAPVRTGRIKLVQRVSHHQEGLLLLRIPERQIPFPALVRQQFFNMVKHFKRRL